MDTKRPAGSLPRGQETTRIIGSKSLGETEERRGGREAELGGDLREAGGAVVSKASAPF